MDLDAEENDPYTEKNFRKAAVKSIGLCLEPEFLVIDGLAPAFRVFLFVLNVFSRLLVSEVS